MTTRAVYSASGNATSAAANAIGANGNLAFFEFKATTQQTRFAITKIGGVATFHAAFGVAQAVITSLAIARNYSVDPNGGAGSLIPVAFDRDNPSPIYDLSLLCQNINAGIYTAAAPVVVGTRVSINPFAEAHSDWIGAVGAQARVDWLARTDADAIILRANDGIEWFNHLLWGAGGIANIALTIEGYVI